MLKAINTKILLSILAALVAITGILYKQSEDRKAATAAAVQTARILKQQQDQAQAERDHNAAFMKKVEEDKKKRPVEKNSKVYTTYVP